MKKLFKNINIKEYLSKELLYLTIAVVSFLLYKYLIASPKTQDFIILHVLRVRTSVPAILYYYRTIVWFTFSFIFLFLTPFLCSWIIEGRDVWNKLGMKFKNPKLGFTIMLSLTLFMFIVIFIAVHLFPAFKVYYPFARYAMTQPSLFIVYEICYFFYFLAWEFYFHSFLIFPYEQKMGKLGALIIGVLPFVILHVGKPIPEVIGSFFAGIALAFLALETRSFWYGMLMHGLVAVFMDIAAVYL